MLDSYEAERVPVGLEVIEDSLAQCGLFAAPSREGVALRDRFNRLLGENPSLSRSLAVRLSGLGIRYAPGLPGVPAAPGVSGVSAGDAGSLTGQALRGPDRTGPVAEPPLAAWLG